MSKIKELKEEASIVKPAIKVNGVDHPLETLFKSGKAPILKAVGMGRLDSKSNSWASYTITIEGDKIKAIEIGEPNMRLIAIDEAKVGFVTNFMDANEEV